MTQRFSRSELECYLDEALSPDAMAIIESALRADLELAKRLAAIHGSRDAGLHSIGEIWRRNRTSCPTRQQLGSYLLGVLDDGHADYVRFHLEIIGCRICQANLDDMQQRQENIETTDRRRRKYFQSSAGFLGKSQ